MYNKTRNPDNDNFDVFVDGTTNVTSTLKAQAFASKGHFLDISEEAAALGSVPVIKNANGEVIKANKDDDDTFLGMEKWTGVNVLARQRIQFNFAVFNDELFEFENNNEYGIFMPLSFVSRQSDMTQDQINIIFGDLIDGLGSKWVFFFIILIVGIVLLALAGFLFYRSRKLRAMELGNDDGGLIDTSALEDELNTGTRVTNTGKLNYTASDLGTDPSQSRISGNRGSEM